ncbi:MAG TPA: phosphatidate cytidylyltransferase [Blastocatellia bacterium]|nr:phosphatidate cytidylyltransferase [Blastocatellia bacterium]
MARIISAVVFLPILIAAILVGSPIYFTALAGLAILFGLIEYYALTDRVGARAGRVQGVLASAVIVVAFYLGRPEFIPASLAALVVIDLTVHLFGSSDLRGAVLATAATVFGVVYVALMGGYLVALRVVAVGVTAIHISDKQVIDLSAVLLSFFFLIVFAGDTGAYYVGRTIGRNKLAPRVSPGKTVEGAVGGLVTNVAAALAAHYTFFPQLPIPHAVTLAVAMGVIGQIGDLCESMLKRGAQAKDAGQIIPGHGGVLDRLDSILFNAPVLYYYYVYFFPK